MIGHGAANLIAVLRAETGVLDFSYEASMGGISFSIAMVVLGVVAVAILFKQSTHKSSR